MLIAPDKAAGGVFAETVFKKLASKGFSVATYYAGEIPPRVETNKETGKAQITSDQEGVSSGLANTIRRAVDDSGAEGVVSITCNTLSLKDAFVERTRELLEKEGLKAGSDHNLLTTIDALKEKYEEEGTEPPVVLGTRVLSEELPKEGLKTLISLGFDKSVDLTQEIIWRVKAVKGSDISTAPDTDNLKDENILRERVKELIGQLKSNGINQVVLGCTELPIAFSVDKDEGYADAKDLEGMTLVDPAEVVADRLEKMMS